MLQEVRMNITEMSGKIDNLSGDIEDIRKDQMKSLELKDSLKNKTQLMDLRAEWL